MQKFSQKRPSEGLVYRAGPAPVGVRVLAGLIEMSNVEIVRGRELSASFHIGGASLSRFDRRLGRIAGRVFGSWYLIVDSVSRHAFLRLRFLVFLNSENYLRSVS